MRIIPVLLILLVTGTPPVEVWTLDGERWSGTLESLSVEEAVLQSTDGLINIPERELLTIRVTGKATSTLPRSLEATLSDGTRLQLTNFTSTTKQARLVHPTLGILVLPMSYVQSVRFAPANKMNSAWQKLLEQPRKHDQVVTEKNDALNHAEGFIGAVDDISLSFVENGADVAMQRESVFGLIYFWGGFAAAKPIAAIELLTGDRLHVKSLISVGELWKLELCSGYELSVPLESIQAVDFTIGKLAYLSDLEPRDVKYTSFFDDFVWKYVRDRSFRDRPITLGNKTYPKGLAIHSKAELKYQIGGEFRRFQAVMGIDDDVRVGGNVDVLIKGDNRILLKGSARAGQTPKILNLDVADVQELEIEVGFGEDELDIGDWLQLADARLMK